MKAIDQLIKMLNSQLTDSKRLVSEFTDKLKDGVLMDLSCEIKLVQDLIDNNVILKTELEKSGVKLKETDAILAETLEYYHTSLRILNRHNKRIIFQPAAKDTCSNSLNTVQTLRKK